MKLFVTKSFVPPMEEYNRYLSKAMEKGWLTNRGELVTKLESRLQDHLSVSNLTLTTNGTLPIQIAIKALGLTGEIITTPFSYVATTSSIVWEGCTPVFVDIEPDFFTIDAAKIESAITEKTSAILATHVFGNPCDVEAIQSIAEKHNLHVIYDAAHCFGVDYKGKSIFEYGDVSTSSFHATKIFHTGEGGCMITKDQELHDRLFYHHNFGHDGPEDFQGIGINAKMSELQAAMGHAVLDHIEDIFTHREEAVRQYRELLSGSSVQLMKIRPDTKWNHHYFPVVFNSEEQLLKVLEVLNENDIFPRRYFYPSLNTLPYVDPQACEIAESVSKRVLCLPLSAEVSTEQIKKVVGLIQNTIS